MYQKKARLSFPALNQPGAFSDIEIRARERDSGCCYKLPEWTSASCCERECAMPESAGKKKEKEKGKTTVNKGCVNPTLWLRDARCGVMTTDHAGSVDVTGLPDGVARLFRELCKDWGSSPAV